MLKSGEPRANGRRSQHPLLVGPNGKHCSSVGLRRCHRFEKEKNWN